MVQSLLSVPGEDAASFVRPVKSDQIQPAGIDLRVDRVYRFTSPGFLGSKRALPETEELEPKNGAWNLAPGSYKVRFSEIVEVPLDFVGLCFPRSSLLRMGVILACTVWDPGYKGRGEALLLVHNAHGFRLEKGVRVAQLVFVKMLRKPSRGYRGAYLGENLDYQAYWY
ncbi:MAG: deoxyuridine 5'-triphosphate nucleotidohydrolase [Desulfurococcales archaeon]|nr:deoxyuridine 5'-triphosphate nucleotidohydrolase [Desulfurococcales archaeon]